MGRGQCRCVADDDVVMTTGSDKPSQLTKSQALLALQLISLAQLGYQVSTNSLSSYSTDLAPPNLNQAPHASLTVEPTSQPRGEVISRLDDKPGVGPKPSIGPKPLVNARVTMELQEAKKMFRGAVYICKYINNGSATQAIRKAADLGLLYDALVERYPNRSIPRVPESWSLITSGLLKRVSPNEEEHVILDLDPEAILTKQYAAWLTTLVRHPVLKDTAAVKAFFVADCDMKTQYKALSRHDDIVIHHD